MQKEPELPHAQRAPAIDGRDGATRTTVAGRSWRLDTEPVLRYRARAAPLVRNLFDRGVLRFRLAPATADGEAPLLDRELGTADDLHSGTRVSHPDLAQRQSWLCAVPSTVRDRGQGRITPRRHVPATAPHPSCRCTKRKRSNKVPIGPSAMRGALTMTGPDPRRYRGDDRGTRLTAPESAPAIVVSE